MGKFCHITLSSLVKLSSPSSHHGKGNEGDEGGSSAKGDEEEGSHEGHEGDEEEGGHEGHEGDEEEGSHEGHEGDEEEGSHEGYEGDEEEVCEQGCAWPDGQGHGSPWKQGEDCWRLDCEGPHQEQVRQDCEQEEQCPCEEVPMDPGRREGTQGIEDHWLRRRQEGHSSVCKGQGVLQPVSATLSQMRVGSGQWRHQLQVWGFPLL